jgi:hypothetical protein
MPLHPAHRGLFVLLAAAWMGCGGVHGIQVDKTATQIGQTVCAKAYSCCTLDQLMSNDAAGTDAADCSGDHTACEHACEAKTADNFRNVLSGIQDSVDRKRAQYEQAKVDACLDTIRSASCPTLNMTNHLMGVPGCDSFVTPLVALGGACGNDYECVGGFCKPPPPSSNAFDGVCTALADVGQSCADANCATGLVCDPKTADVADDICVQPGDTGAVCSDAFECKSGLCSTSGGSGTTCAAPTGGGQCFYSSGCAAAGEGRPSVFTLLLFAAFIAVALVRARRSRA